MTRTAAILFLTPLLLRACHAPQTRTPTPAGEPTAQEATPQRQNSEMILGDDVVKIIVFPPCVDFKDKLTGRRRPCQFEIHYELERSLSEGRLEIFNALQVEPQYSLPDLSAGKHTIAIPDILQGFYWPDDQQTLPDPMLFCAVGAGSLSLMVEQLWEKSYSGSSAYNYKPPRPPKEVDDPKDPAAAYRGDDLGFSAFNIPYKRNLELRSLGQLPEVEILGVGFTEGTPAECGKGVNPERFFTSPLRDVRVVSTVSHDGDDSIPVLKSARFTVPRDVFNYPNHVRIVGKLNP